MRPRSEANLYKRRRIYNVLYFYKKTSYTGTVNSRSFYWHECAQKHALNCASFLCRFEKNKTQHTKILFLTEGLLLRQMESDQFLSGYTLVILDEVHERHLHMDFLLGVLRCLVQVGSVSMYTHNIDVHVVIRMLVSSAVIECN